MKLEDCKYELTEQFRFEVSRMSSVIDPDKEYMWYDLTLGWAIGKGLSPGEAHDFARYIRYETDLG